MTDPSSSEQQTAAAEEKKERQRMARVTARTQDILLKAAEATYPRHSQAEIIEKALEALLGTTQPYYKFLLQDPELQIQIAAILAEFALNMENKVKAITRARFGDVDDRNAARQAVIDLLALKDAIRDAVKEIMEDALQMRKTVETVARSLAGAEKGVTRLQERGKQLEQLAADRTGKGDNAAAKKFQDEAVAVRAEANAITAIINVLAAGRSSASTAGGKTP